MTPKTLRSAGVLFCLGLAAAVAWGQGNADADPGANPAPDPFALEHQRIDALRDQKTKAFDEQEKACASKFAVTDCENAIKAQRREMLADFRRQEVTINDAQRKQKAAQRTQATADKAADSALHQADVQAQAERGKTQEERQKDQDEKVLNHKNQAHAPVVKAPKTGSGPDAKTAEKNRQAYAEKLKDLEKRRQERDKNVREHGTSGPPLPQPVQ